MSLRLITEPEGDIVTLEQAKAQCFVMHDDDNDTIESLVAAAAGHLDGYAGILGRALLTQEWALDLDRFPFCGPIDIPLPPLIEVVSVTYFDAVGAQQTLDLNNCIVHPGPFGMVEMEPGKAWPITQCRRNAVTVTFSAGYGEDPGDVPKPIAQAILLLVAHWYENREPVTSGSWAELPISVTALLTPLRVQRL